MTGTPAKQDVAHEPALSPTANAYRPMKVIVASRVRQISGWLLLCTR